MGRSSSSEGWGVDGGSICCSHCGGGSADGRAVVAGNTRDTGLFRSVPSAPPPPPLPRRHTMTSRMTNGMWAGRAIIHMVRAMLTGGYLRCL